MIDEANRLSARAALITGASRGIGKGIALELAAGGCDIVLTARDKDLLESVAGEVRALGCRARVHAADLTQLGEPERLADIVRNEFGRLDILVNNAGGVKRGSLFTLTDRDWQDGFALKFFAHVRLSRETWPLLKDSGGSVVFICGTTTSPRVADYMIGAAVVAAGIAFMEALADLGKRDGVQVVAVNPGNVDTDRLRHRLGIIMKKTGMTEAEAIEHHRKELDITRFGTPADIAGLIRFLTSPAGRWVHGTSIDIDGGQINPVRMSKYE